MHPIRPSLALPHGLAAWLFVWVVGAPVLPGAGDGLERRVDAAAGAAMAAESIRGLSIAIDVGGELVLAKGFGEDPTTGARAAASSAYRAGALAEAFLATAILQLASQGELGLEDPLAKHLPALEAKKDVTVHDLLAHTSGLASYASYAVAGRRHGEDPTAAEIAAWIAAAPSDAAVGSCRTPTDSDELLLGLLLEQAAKTPVPLALEQRVFAPAGMEDTRYCKDGPPLDEGAGATRERGDDVVTLDEGSAAFDAAALCSTVLDLVAWQRALVDRSLVDDETYELLVREIRLADGRLTKATYAFELVRLDGIEGFAVGGGLAGGRAHLAYYPEADLTVAVLADAEDARIDLLERRLARAVLDLPDPTAVEELLDPAAQAPYAGSYYVGCSEYRVVVGAKRLAVHPPVGATFELLYRGGRRFASAEDPDVVLEFVLEEGRVEAFYIEERGSRIRAQRM